MKRFLSCLLALILIFSCICNVFAYESKNSKWLGTNDIYKKDTSIDSKLDNQNLAYILSNVFELKDIQKEIEIKDVEKDSFYYQDIINVTDRNIMFIDEQGYFYPTDFVTREEFVYYLSNFVIATNQKYSNVVNKLEDVNSISEDKKQAYLDFIASGFISVDSSYFSFPKRIITVREVFDILSNIYPNIMNGMAKNVTYSNFLAQHNWKSISDLNIDGNLYLTESVLDVNNRTIKVSDVEISGDIHIHAGSRLGQYVFENVECDNIIVYADEPVLLTLKDCEYNAIEHQNNIQIIEKKSV